MTTRAERLLALHRAEWRLQDSERGRDRRPDVRLPSARPSRRRAHHERGSAAPSSRCGPHAYGRKQSAEALIVLAVAALALLGYLAMLDRAPPY